MSNHRARIGLAASSKLPDANPVGGRASPKNMVDATVKLPIDGQTHTGRVQYSRNGTDAGLRILSLPSDSFTTRKPGTRFNHYGNIREAAGSRLARSSTSAMKRHAKVRTRWHLSLGHEAPGREHHRESASKTASKRAGVYP